MDSDDWLQSLHLPTGSKRPSPSPSIGENLGAKKQRTSPEGNEQPDGGLPSPEMPLFNVNFERDAVVYQDQSTVATGFNVAHRDQFRVPTAGEVGYSSNIANEFDTGDSYTGDDDTKLWQYLDENYEEVYRTIAGDALDAAEQPTTSTQYEGASDAKSSSAHDEANNGCSPTPLLDPSSDTCCDYDTCFGVVSHTFPDLHLRLWLIASS